MNLLSIPSFDAKGYIGSWGRGVLSVKDPKSGDIIIDGKLAQEKGSHKLYQVDIIQASESSSSSHPSQSALATGISVHAGGNSLWKPCSLAMWHARFAHINTNVIALMKRRELVDGLDITDSNLEGKCEPCIHAKATRRPFDSIVTPATEVLFRISLDLWGKARTMSLGGAWYLLLAVDDATGVPSPSFSATKDAPTILVLVIRFVRKAEKQTGKKVKRIRIDMGREFDNKLMDDWAASEGIIIEKIPKHSSAANGMVERANRTVIEGARAMIEDSSLDWRFWAEAVEAFCYVTSMVPTSRVPGVIPIQSWYPEHAKVNVSHLCKWGCRVLAKDLDRREGKLGIQTFEGFLVGYLDRRGWHIWDPVRRHVFPIREGEFDEGIPNRTRSESVEYFPLPLTDSDQDLPEESLDDLDDESDLLQNQNEDLPPNDRHPDIEHQDDEGIILRRSAQRSAPSQALQRSKQYEEDERRAREGREEWANILVLASTVKGAGKALNPIPTRYDQAMREPELWMPPMRKEFESLEERKCWVLVDKPLGAKVLKGMWVYDLKVDGGGEILARKARWVARGDMQRPGVDFDRTWSMVARMESVRILIACAAANGWATRQWDFSSAYLNGTLPEYPQIFMEQTTGFTRQGEEEKVCLMKKPLYGLAQAGHIWFKELKKEAERVGFKCSRADPCIRYRRNPETGAISIHSVHTDDIWSAASDEDEAEKSMKDFGKWDLKDVKDKKFLVGLTIEYFEDGGIGVSQAPFVISAFRFFGIWDELYPLDTPLPPKYHVTPATDYSEEDAKFMSNKPYRRILGCCWWLASSTRPDIVFACSSLSSVQNAPTRVHWDLLIKLCRYIKSTVNYGIVYKKFDVQANIQPLGYVDADWAGNPHTRKSVSGYIFLINGSPVSWSSKPQAITALSSTEAEYVSMARGVQQAVWLNSWLAEVGIGGERPVKILCDNLGAISLSETTREHGISKAIDVRYHFIRDEVAEKKVEIFPVASKNNIADIMTKSLSKDLHRRFVSALGLDWWYRRQGEC